MSDESQLQVTRKRDDSSLILASGRSSLVARGRRDAVVLAVRCNKCGEPRELVFAGCVCAHCSDAFDRQWATCAATDWVLVTDFLSESRKQSDQIRKKLNDCAAKWTGEQVHTEATMTVTDTEPGPVRHFFRNTTYAQMKLRWADEKSLNDDTLSHRYLGAITAEEMDFIGSTPIPYIRPAAPEEIAEYRNALRSQVISEVLERMNLDDEGMPHSIDSVVIPPIDLGWRVALIEELSQRLEQQGLEQTHEELSELCDFVSEFLLRG